MKKLFYSTSYCFSYLGNPRVTPEVTRDVCLLARLMAANLYFSQIENLMFEVSMETLYGLSITCIFENSSYIT